jgi:hypothetical protein
MDWSFVVRYDPRRRLIKYTHLQEEDDTEDQEYDSIDQTELEDHGGSTDEENEEDHDPSEETIVQFLMTMSMKICSKMILMTMTISSILSTLFQNRMMIHMLSLMKKIKIENKDDYTDFEVGLGT